MNYAQGEQQHVRTEFAFDIDEIANHRFAPVDYLRHVGLEVPTRQLALAFYQTYGLREDFTQTRHERVNESEYRWAVHRFIPRIAYSTTLLHRHHEPADVTSDPDVQRLNQEVTAIEQENHWDDYRKHAGVLTYTLAGLLFILPKVGPIRFTSVKGPTTQTELEYVHSVMRSTDVLNRALRRFTPPPSTRPSAQEAAAADTHSLPPPSEPLPAKPGASQAVPRDSRDPHHPLLNRDLDTGNPVKPAGYRLTDQTYAYLLHQLTKTPTCPYLQGIKDDILAYYADMSLPFATKKDPDRLGCRAERPRYPAGNARESVAGSVSHLRRRHERRRCSASRHDNAALELAAHLLHDAVSLEAHNIRMFERYNEKARRTIFFARYEASQFGSP